MAGVIAGHWYHKMYRPSGTKGLLNPCLIQGLSPQVYRQKGEAGTKDAM